MELEISHGARCTSLILPRVTGIRRRDLKMLVDVEYPNCNGMGGKCAASIQIAGAASSEWMIVSPDSFTVRCEKCLGSGVVET